MPDSADTLRGAATRLREGPYVHPVRGAKLADLLEEAAEHLEVDLRDPDIDVCGTAVEGLACSLLSGALSLARSILGEEAESDG